MSFLDRAQLEAPVAEMVVTNPKKQNPLIPSMFELLAGAADT